MEFSHVGDVSGTVAGRCGKQPCERRARTREKKFRSSEAEEDELCKEAISTAGSFTKSRRGVERGVHRRAGLASK